MFSLSTILIVVLGITTILSIAYIIRLSNRVRTLEPKNVPASEPLSLGTRLAEKTRAVANTLPDEERERLLHKGMQLIYAGRRQKKPARRR